MTLNTSCSVCCSVQLPPAVSKDDIEKLKIIVSDDSLRWEIDSSTLFNFIGSHEYYKTSKHFRAMLKELHIGHEDLYHNAHKFIFHH